MNMNKAISRLTWRFKTNKPFLPSQEDINALNDVIEYVGVKEKQQLIDNQLFGKMYIYLYMEFLRHYETTVFDPIPQKELHKLLDKPLKAIVSDFVGVLNTNELYISTDLKKSVKSKIWDYNEVAENLRIQVNAAINTYTKP